MSSRKRFRNNLNSQHILPPRENLRNGLTLGYLTGNNRWVYKIKSPNGRHHVLTNRAGFARLINGSIFYANSLIRKPFFFPYVGRHKNNIRNMMHPAVTYLPNQYVNVVPATNYTFRKYNNNWGTMKNVRGPFGVPMKLTNVNLYQLPKENLRNLRALRLQNTRNAEQSAREQAQKRAANNAERQRYVYRVKYPSIHNTRQLVTSILRPNLSVMSSFPKNAEPVTNASANKQLANFKRNFHARMMLYFPGGNYNLSRVKIYQYKLKN